MRLVFLHPSFTLHFQTFALGFSTTCYRYIDPQSGHSMSHLQTPSVIPGAPLKLGSDRSIQDSRMYSHGSVSKGTDTLALGDLHWWTTADHVIEAAADAGAKIDRTDILFAEHKVNGKTKGNVIIKCHSPKNADAIHQWFNENEFQGKKLSPSFVHPSTTQPFKAPNQREFRTLAMLRLLQLQLAAPGPRPVLGTQALLAHGPTNAHGGINFNRVRPNSRAVQQHLQSNVGIGWPKGAHDRYGQYQERYTEVDQPRHDQQTFWGRPVQTKHFGQHLAPGTFHGSPYEPVYAGGYADAYL